MPYDPSTLTGKAVWLRASDLPAGSSYSVLPDQSGNALNPQTNFNTTVVSGATPSGGKAMVGTALYAGYNQTPVFNLYDYSMQASLSSVWGGASGEYLVDGSLNNNAVIPASTGWVKLHPTAGPIVATSYQISFNNASLSQAPKNWTFEGSQDGNTWTILDTRTNEVFTGGGTNSYSFANATAYAYYRLNVSASNGDNYISIAEIKINNIVNVATPSDAEMWIVLKTSGGSGPAAWLYGNSGQSSHYTYSGSVYDDFGATSRQSFVPTLDPSQWRLYRVAVVGTSWKAWIDNVQQLSATVTKSWITGNQTQLLRNFSGSVAEILVVRRGLTDPEVADLITYFNRTHGLTVAGGSSAPTPPTYVSVGTPTASASSTAAGSSAANLFDGGAGYWEAAVVASTGAPVAVVAQYASAKTVDQYSIKARADNPEKAPSSWTFEGSNDGVNWTVINSHIGEVFSAAQTKKYTTGGQSGAYTYYRLNVTQNGITTSAPSFDEWKLEQIGTGGGGGGGTTTTDTFSAPLHLFGTSYAAGDAIPADFSARRLRWLTKRGYITPAGTLLVKRPVKVDGTSYAAGTTWAATVVPVVAKKLLRGRYIGK